MKILLINNYHYLRGGSERAYFDTAEILAKHGHEVAFFSTENPKNQPTPWSKYFVSEIDFEEGKTSLPSKIKFLSKGFYNFEAKKKLAGLIDDFKPDIAHLHNIYHHLSPSVIDVLKKKHIPMIMTLHDYQLISPNYSLFARGEIWEGSRAKKYWRCFTDRCVKDSYWQSFLAAIEAYFFQWLGVCEKIKKFISPSRFLIDKFEEFDFKKEIIYLPNPFPPEATGAADDKTKKGKYILYYGRLNPEKGIDDLLRAYARLKTGTKLRIVGAGPEEEKLKNIIVQEKISLVEFAGYKKGEELWREVRGAEAVIIPSRWYENAPYGAIEAMAAGKIVIAAGIGGLAELIRDGENGFLFAPGNVRELSEKMNFVLSDPELEKQIGVRARAAIKEKNDPEKYYQTLIKIYQQAKNT
jgi:glycosyltransferase involved in cell wall biosynthesis